MTILVMPSCANDRALSFWLPFGPEYSAMAPVVKVASTAAIAALALKPKKASAIIAIASLRRLSLATVCAQKAETADILLLQNTRWLLKQSNFYAWPLAQTTNARNEPQTLKSLHLVNCSAFVNVLIKIFIDKLYTQIMQIGSINERQLIAYEPIKVLFQGFYYRSRAWLNATARQNIGGESLHIA
jgi:hypothetical protein